MNEKEISTGELFADLQVSLTEIVLVGMLTPENKSTYQKRQDGNEMIADKIKVILRNRFSDEQIMKFLDVGFPRQVDLSRTQMD